MNIEEPEKTTIDIIKSYCKCAVLKCDWKKEEFLLKRNRKSFSETPNGKSISECLADASEFLRQHGQVGENSVEVIHNLADVLLLAMEIQAELRRSLLFIADLSSPGPQLSADEPAPDTSPAGLRSEGE